MIKKIKELLEFLKAYKQWHKQYTASLDSGGNPTNPPPPPPPGDNDDEDEG